MPFVNIKITKEEHTTPDHKAALIRGVTDLLSQVLDKDPALTFVVIEEVELRDWGHRGVSIAQQRRGQHGPCTAKRSG